MSGKNDKTASDKKSLSDSAELFAGIIREEPIVDMSDSVWRRLERKRKIIQLINHLISNRVEIQIRLKGENAAFTSKFIKLKQEDTPSKIGKRHVLIIEKLSPEKGNALIQSLPVVDAEFSINRNLCRCALKYIGINSTSPDFGFILGFPESVEIEEKRRVERFAYEAPEFISVEFRLGEKTKNGKLYELNVLDCSKYGLGMVITQKNFDLLRILRKGDKLKDILFFASQALIKVNGTVSHITKIEYGVYKGCYLLGINSLDIIESCKPANQ